MSKATFNTLKDSCVPYFKVYTVISKSLSITFNNTARIFIFVCFSSADREKGVDAETPNKKRKKPSSKPESPRSKKAKALKYKRLARNLTSFGFDVERALFEESKPLRTPNWEYVWPLCLQPVRKWFFDVSLRSCICDLYHTVAMAISSRN